MPTFSERHGLKTARAVFQRESLDDETRMAIWNVVAILPEAIDRYDELLTNTLTSFWVEFFARARDERPSYDDSVLGVLKQTILESEWWRVFDAIEFLVSCLDHYQTGNNKQIGEFVLDALNSRFEQFLVGYRIIGGRVTPIDSAVDADAVVSALADAEPIEGARHHLETALDLLSDRQNPDYANTIKESISAVESACKVLTSNEKATLGDALKRLSDHGVQIDSALSKAWSTMYGWTSNADGIRHGGIAAATADQTLAKYVLVTCSAFVSYLIEEGRKAGVF